MTYHDATFVEKLSKVVGREHVLTAPSEMAPFLVDWRARFHGAAQAVVQPANTPEVARVVAVCADANVPIVPQGGNTGMCGAATPDQSGNEVVISLARLRTVREVDPDNATITVDAGVTLAEVQQAAAEAGLLFPLSLASDGSCTIGGNLSTNAGGTAVLRYGNTRELVLGVEVVLADGRIWNGLRGLRKDNSGYDLKQLFIGSEGTLGILTAAVLKLFAAPRSRVTALAAMASVGHQRLRARTLAQASPPSSRSAARSCMVCAAPGERQHGRCAPRDAGRERFCGGGGSVDRRGCNNRSIGGAGRAPVGAA
jgi:FAD/FMN-containing dehydrogenase